MKDEFNGEITEELVNLRTMIYLLKTKKQRKKK